MLLTKKNLGFMLAAFMVAFLVMSCAGMKIFPDKSWLDMAPKERAVYTLAFYNSQWADYKDMAARPDLTEAQKEILRWKKDILVELEPLIGAYIVATDSGEIVSPELEEQMLSLLNMLGAEITKE